MTVKETEPLQLLQLLSPCVLLQLSQLGRLEATTAVVVVVVVVVVVAGIGAGAVVVAVGVAMAAVAAAAVAAGAGRSGKQLEGKPFIQAPTRYHIPY